MANTNPWDVTSPTQQQKPPDNPWAGGDQSTLISGSAVPQTTAQQYGESPELQDMLKGSGFSPNILANMKATAMEGPAAAGAQEMAGLKRSLAASGLGYNPASAGYEENVAKRTGQAQVGALRDVDTANGQLSEQQKQLGLQQQTGIGLSNMQAANAAALDNANRMFQVLLQNQGIRYGTQQAVAGMQ